MAESVDALVSNTSGAIRAGSTPALGTESEISAKVSDFLLRNNDEDKIDSGTYGGDGHFESLCTGNAQR